MSKRLPDEYFRQTTSESTDVRATRPEPTRTRIRSSSRRQPGVPWRIVMASGLAALLLGFAGVRVATELSSPAPTPPPVPTTTTRLDLAPYEGPTLPTSILNATGNCTRGGPDLAPSLFDSSPETVWRCPGGGVGETVTFDLPVGTQLVGLRIVNGNLTGGAYLQDRRILSIRWTFSDGSWVVQPLAANETEDQEVRFPPVTTDHVVMSVLSTTNPGVDGEEHDAVVVSRVTFLGPG